MTTCDDVIAAINQRRKPLTIRPDPSLKTPGSLPIGWQQWLNAMPVVDAHTTGSWAPALVELMVQRPLRPPPPARAALSHWQAICSMLRQQWEPDFADERSMRISAGAIDIVLHIILIGLFLWLLYLRFTIPPAAAEGDNVVQVEFIGRGNVAEGGGALANAGAQSGPAAAAPASRAVTPRPATGTPDAPIISMQVPEPAQISASSEVPKLIRELPSPVAEAAQPLQVSDVREPAPRSFQLPPTKLRELQLPQVETHDVQPEQQVEAIVTLKPQPVRTLKPREVQPELRAPQLQQQIQEIEVPQPQRLTTLPARAVPAQATSSLQMPKIRGEIIDIPMPSGGAPMASTQSGQGIAQQPSVATGAGGERGAAPAAAGTTPVGRGQGTELAAQSGRGVASTGAGAGPGSKPAPGGWPSVAKSDDWGAASRNVAGTGVGDGAGTGKGRDGVGKPGLFDGDGGVRLADEWTEQSGIDVDRSGTWLKRPGLEYRGTRFDQYWVPGGTLLEEWVRKGIKKVAIPIPGSKRQLRCVVSILPPGAICNPYSPDVNEQPARARPPPDVPFKPELQEDNGSVKPANP